jgi:hypothetical protein
MEGRVVSRGRLGREWPHAILSNMARQIDRVTRQGGEGVQDALYMSEGACPADLPNPTPLAKWLLKYVSMLRIHEAILTTIIFNSVDPHAPHIGQQTAETTQLSPLA